GISKFIFDPGVHPPPSTTFDPYAFIELLDIPIDPIGSISTTLATPGLFDVVILQTMLLHRKKQSRKAVALPAAKGSPWKWTHKQEKAFQKLSLILTCDASAHGVWCVLAQNVSCGGEAPVAFHSRTLAAAECQYAQIDREAIKNIVRLKKFYNCVSRHPVEIRADYKPLLSLMNGGAFCTVN
ncbi:hypothetical protein T01_8059, partial [Trichinella spiralis]